MVVMDPCDSICKPSGEVRNVQVRQAPYELGLISGEQCGENSTPCQVWYQRVLDLVFERLQRSQPFKFARQSFLNVQMTVGTTRAVWQTRAIPPSEHVLGWWDGSLEHKAAGKMQSHSVQLTHRLTFVTHRRPKLTPSPAV